MRTWNDVVHIWAEHKQLMQHALAVLRIVIDSGYMEVKPFSLVKIVDVKEEYLVLGLIAVTGGTTYTQVPIYDEASAPPGLGLGWEPMDEDIIGYETQSFASGTSLEMRERIKIPVEDLENVMLEDVEAVKTKYRNLAARKKFAGV